METDKELILKIRQLKAIKPKSDWVFLTKQRIFEQEPATEKIGFFTVLRIMRFAWRPALASFVCLFLVFGLTKNSLPGDPLYLLKRAVEKTRLVFVAEQEKSGYNFEIANKRLQDLNKIAKSNDVRKLAAGIQEFQASISDTVKGLKATSSDHIAIDFEKFCDETQQLEITKQEVEGILATRLETGDLEKTLAELYGEFAEKEIRELEGKTLTETQKNILEKAKQDYNDGQYESALRKLYILSYL